MLGFLSKVRENRLKIALVSFEDGVVAIGVRRLSSYLRQFYPDLETYFYNVVGNKSYVLDRFFTRTSTSIVSPEFCKRLAQADVVGISCMSRYAKAAAEFARVVKEIRPDCYIVWGGTHASFDPDDAIQFADAVCIGEGEIPFREVLQGLEAGELSTSVGGFWFRQNGNVIRNPVLPLLPGAEMEKMPFQDFSLDLLYADASGIKPLDGKTYVSVQGTKYTTVWSIGCPFKCSFCGNTRYLELDKSYAKLRYPSPAYIVAEIKSVLQLHPYITFIEFQDDEFFFIKREDIIEFARLYAKEIGLPLFVPGVYPGTVRDGEILDALIDAGLVKLRMGIQSGSKRILNFFQRPTPIENIRTSANIMISRYPRVSTFFDIIVDIPIETEQDCQDTLALLKSLSRPFFIYLYSLRLIPNTSLDKYAKAHPNLPFHPIHDGYNYIYNKRFGSLMLLTALMPAPAWLERLVDRLTRIRLVDRFVFSLITLAYYAKRFFDELSHLNLQPLSVFTPQVTLALHRSGILQKIVARRRKRVEAVAAMRPRVPLAARRGPPVADPIAVLPGPSHILS